MIQHQDELTLCEVGGDAVLPSFSPFCLKVRVALSAGGFAVRYRTGRVPADFQEYNPLAKVPVLLAKGRPICDSTEILAFLRRAGGGWGPLSRRALAGSLLWEELADTTLNGFVVAARWADERNWPGVSAAYFAQMPPPVRAVVPDRLRAGVIARLEAREIWDSGAHACWRRFELMLDQLESVAPTDAFWCGHAPSEADFAIFGQLHSLRHALTPWQAEQIGTREVLSSWLDRVAEAGLRQTT